MSLAERHDYDEHLSTIMIQNDVLDGAKLEGRMEGKIEIAKKMKWKGLDIDTIREVTGLLPEEILKL